MYRGKGNILTSAAITRPTHPELELVEGFVKDRISIVMPAYNEAKCIGKSIADAKKQFEAVSEDCEIIVVDDGSNDGTRRIIEELRIGNSRL